MLEGKTISAMLPRSWKKSFSNGVVIPVKMRRCNNCNGEILCNGCNNQVKENKEFEAILKSLKRHAPNHFGYILPYYIIQKRSGFDLTWTISIVSNYHSFTELIFLIKGNPL